MMNNVQIAQIIGATSVFILFSLKLYIVANAQAWERAGRTAVLWTTMYVFFLFILRLISLFNLASIDELRVMSGYAAILPLLGVMAQLFLVDYEKKDNTTNDNANEAKKILQEAKEIRAEASNMLTDAKQKADE